MEFPGDALDWEAQMPVLRINSIELRPKAFMLFNSSIEPRKNLLFALKAYIESGIDQHGIRFCITGMLKKDSYSKAVSKMVKENPWYNGISLSCKSFNAKEKL